MVEYLFSVARPVCVVVFVVPSVLVEVFGSRRAWRTSLVIEPCLWNVLNQLH